MGKNVCVRVGCKDCPAALRVNVYLLSLCQAAALEPGSGFAPLAQAGVRQQWVAPCRGLLIAPPRFMRPGAWSGPWAGMKTVAHGSAPRAGRQQVQPGQAAGLSTPAGAFFASLVLQEQLLHDPTPSHTWLSPSLLPLNPKGFPGKKEERRVWKRELLESHWSLHLSTWPRQAPTSQTVIVFRLEGACLSRRSPEDLRPGHGEWGRSWFV